MLTCDTICTDGRGERGDRTARCLLEAAKHIFAARGFAGASVRDIARAADANPALIRYHFGSKEGLYRKVIEEVMGALRDRMLEAFQVGDSVGEKLEHIVDSIVAHMTQHEEFPMLVQRALLDGDARTVAIARDTLRPMLESVRPLVTAVGQTQVGGLNDIIMSFFGALMGPFLYRPMLGALFGEDPLAPDVLERRTAHIKSLLYAVTAVVLNKENQDES